MSIAVLLTLVAIFAELSLLAFGGANSVLPEMQRQVVDLQGWVSATDFSALFALAQTAPGPNMMIVTLIGWRVASWPGAILATIGLVTPSSLLTIFTITLWNRFRDAPWRKIVQAGIFPVTAGLIAAGAALIVVTADRDWKLAAITAIVAVLFMTTKLHPLWLLAGGALCGLLGAV
jgi:chromate transporter